METLAPIRVYTLGDYKLKGLRQACHEAKRGDYLTIRDYAEVLAKKLPKHCTLVPIPSHHSETFCQMIANFSGLPISRCLQRREGVGSLYEKKKRGERVTEEDTGISLFDNAPKGKVVLVDNVIATGTTMSAAIRAIGKPCEAVCIAIDFSINNKS
jgi:predicted amidophosphoribosyltransferase